VARLKQTETLNKKLEASLERLRGTGKSVEAAIGPLAGNTQNLQLLGTSMCLHVARTPFNVWQISRMCLRR
jgi:hypothetical protein